MYSLAACLFNQKYQVPKTSGQLPSHFPSQFVKTAHSTSSQRKLGDENCLNVVNEIFDQVLTKKDQRQA